MVQRDQVSDASEPSTCGIRLARLTWPKPSGLGRGEAFIHFLTLFMNIDSDEVVARQFGLAQALPAPLLPDTDDQLVHYELDDLGKLEHLLDRNHERIEEQFNRQSFPEIARCWQCTQSFTTWWSKYFKTHTRHIGPSFSNMTVPTKTKDKTPSPTSDRQQDRGKAIASGSRKRNTRSHSRGLPSKKALRIGESSRTPATARVLRPRQARTPFSNKESSPIEADEEDTEGEDVPPQTLFTTPTLAVAAPSSSEHTRSEPRAGSKDTAEPEATGDVPPIPATLSRVAAKIMSLLGFPLEDLATDDKLKADLISAINTLDDELPVSEADLIHQFDDFVSGLYSSDLLALADHKKEAVDCLEATLQISQVLDQGRKSEQEAVARVEALEVELVAAKEGLANIRSANEDLLGKLKRYEENKASLATATFKAEIDMGRARASFNAAEKKVEALDQLCNRLKLSLDRFI
ncbi:hypothetical protein PIB30_065262 [Stylosanthes scabra]|uniref:Uncharacterized protein n=1 Tax=Stylosanthes scabra TaxID=79078 RepID=A0ABU6TPC6_9FABA|nr:hypothetical protein [Stylosanthes scabra]